MVTSYICELLQEQGHLTTVVQKSAAMFAKAILSAHAGITHAAWPTKVVTTIAVRAASKGNHNNLAMRSDAVKDYRSL